MVAVKKNHKIFHRESRKTAPDTIKNQGIMLENTDQKFFQNEINY